MYSVVCISSYTKLFLHMQLSSKDAIAQNIMAHDALYKRVVLLDQFKEGLRRIGIFQLIATCPNEMSGLFINEGTLTSAEVCGALYLEDDEVIDPDNEIVFQLLQRYIDTLTEEGMQFSHDIISLFTIVLHILA